MNCIFLRRGYGTSGDGVNYVEYIESSGTQFIDTGLSMPKGYRIVCEIEFTNLTSEQAVVGAYDSTSPSYRSFIVKPSRNIWQLGFYDYTEVGTVAVNTKYALDYCNVTGNVYFKVNGSSLYTNTSTSVNAQRSSRSLYLLGINASSNTKAKAKLYSCQFYNENGVLVADYAPALDPDGIACVYDEVSKKYVYNAGTGTFTAGASISGGSGGGGSSKYTLTIKDDYGSLTSGYEIEVNGTSYPKDTTLAVDKGATVSLINNGGMTVGVYLNGTQVGTTTYNNPYKFQITANTTVRFTNSGSQTVIYITTS